MMCVAAECQVMASFSGGEFTTSRRTFEKALNAG